MLLYQKLIIAVRKTPHFNHLTTSRIPSAMWTQRLNQSFAAPQPPVHPESLAYFIHVITYLAAHQTGTFNCVFYELHQSESYNNFLGQLLQSPKLDHIAKVVLDGSFQTTYDFYPNKPSLMVLHVGNRDVSKSADLGLLKSLMVWDPSCRVMVLADVSLWSVVHAANLILTACKFHHMVTIGTGHFQIVRFGSKSTEHVHPGNLFQDRLRDLEGFSLQYSVRFSTHVTIITPNGPIGPDVKWIQETARHLNGTTRYVPNPCSQDDKKLIDLCYIKFTLKEKIIITLDRLSYIGLRPKDYRTLFSVTPSSDGVVVPTGRQLNVVELFLKPFSWTAWMWLIVVLAAMEAVRFKMPDVLRNDPILLAICGIERYDLHHAGRWEKISYISLIIAFFVMTSAYEAKIIAFMTDPPSTGSIQSFEKLSQSGLKVKANLGTHPNLVNDSIIGPLMVNSSIDMDGVNAYYTNQETANVFLTLPVNFDFKSNSFRYVLLPATLKMVVTHYVLRRRSQFLEVLDWTQRVFFESGLRDHWQIEVLMKHLHPTKHWKLAERDDPTGDGLLGIHDLAPAWIALGVGLSICVCVFVAEIFVNHRRVRSNHGRHGPN